MSRGRKPNPPTPPIEAHVNEAAVAEATLALTREDKRLMEINAKFGDGTFHREKIEQEARLFFSQSAEMILEGGKRLILLKENLPHGEFMISLERIGVPYRMAQRTMQATYKFTGEKQLLLAHLSKSKLLELLAEDDEELEALAQGGTLAGLTLDEIERMSARELKATLRQEREARKQDKEANERLLSDKNKKIDELDGKLHYREQLKGDALDEEHNTLITRAGARVRGAFLELEVAYNQILTRDQIPNHLREACSAETARCMHAIMDLAGRWGLDINLREIVYPEWVEQSEEGTRERELIAQCIETLAAIGLDEAQATALGTELAGKTIRQWRIRTPAGWRALGQAPEVEG